MEKEYVIKTKPDFPWNPQANKTIERIHLALKNLVRTYKIHVCMYITSNNKWDS